MCVLGVYSGLVHITGVHSRYLVEVRSSVQQFLPVVMEGALPVIVFNGLSPFLQSKIRSRGLCFTENCVCNGEGLVSGWEGLVSGWEGLVGGWEGR